MAAAAFCTASGSGPGRKAGKRVCASSTMTSNIAFVGRHGIARIACHVDVHGTRRPGRRFAERLPQDVRYLLHKVDAALPLRYRLIQRLVGHFLVGVAVLVLRDVAAREGDHRRMTQVRVLHACGEIRGAYRLRHAHARAAGDTRVAVGHVGDGLLGMAEDALDPDILHLGEDAAQDRVHEEHVRHAVRPDHPREQFRAAHLFRHRSSP